MDRNALRKIFDFIEEKESKSSLAYKILNDFDNIRDNELIVNGNLNLESAVSYGNLLDPQMGYVDTINPSSSLLYNSMNSTSNPMPPNGKLDKCKIELILKWIEQKAKNN